MNSFKVSFVFVLVFFAYTNSSRITLDPSRKYNGVTPCESNDDCDHLLNATCQDSICMCGESRICEDKIKRVVTKIGETCTESDDCNIEHAECSSDNKCVCRSGYVKSTNAKRCFVISEGIGGTCEDSVQCYTKIAYSGCQSNKCVCQQHTHEYSGSCHRSVELGQNCNSNSECYITDFSECVNSKCTCRDKYVASTKGSRCLLVADGIRSLCVDDAQCTRQLGGSSECTNGFCECKEMYQLKNTTNKCVRDMLLGEICENHSDCHGPYPGRSRLECVLGVCECKSFFVEINGYCISSAKNVKVSLVVIFYYLVITLLQIF